MANTNITEAQAAEALGINVAELRAFRAKQDAQPVLEGKINQGEEVKFGVVSLQKVHANGFRKSFGLSQTQGIAARDFLLMAFPLDEYPAQ